MPGKTVQASECLAAAGRTGRTDKHKSQRNGEEKVEHPSTFERAKHVWLPLKQPADDALPWTEQGVAMFRRPAIRILRGRVETSDVESGGPVRCTALGDGVSRCCPAAWSRRWASARSDRRSSARCDDRPHRQRGGTDDHD